MSEAKKKKPISMTPEQYSSVFDLRCRSKRGEKLTRQDIRFLETMLAKFPDQYTVMDQAVFDETRPFGSFL